MTRLLNPPTCPAAAAAPQVWVGSGPAACTITFIGAGGQDAAGKAMEGGWQGHCGSHFSDLSQSSHDFIEQHLTTLLDKHY